MIKSVYQIISVGATSICEEDGRPTDRQTDRSKAICPPFFERGHRNYKNIICLYQEIQNLSFDKQSIVYLPVVVLEQFITSPVSLPLDLSIHSWAEYLG